VRQYLLAHNLLLKGARLSRDQNNPTFLIIPLSTQIDGAVKRTVLTTPPRPTLPRHELIGSIALMQDEDCKGAEEILSQRPNITTVLHPTSTVEGPYRTKTFLLLAGIDTRSTLHTEHGKQFYIDLEKAYFSARLAHERQRIVSKMNKGERVLDMSAGVGPFCVMLSPLAEIIYGVDINSAAIALMQKNLQKNNIRNVIPVLADSMNLTGLLLTPFDRVIINMPLDARKFLPTSFALCKAGGTIHWYVLVSREAEHTALLYSMGAHLVMEQRVRSYAPDKFHAMYEITR
ncbi:MAG: methyltransferase, partial [Methanomicrobiales archaeon]|nr:methyltransferase [Methanomicrobiales archaeon]